MSVVFVDKAINAASRGVSEPASLQRALFKSVGVDPKTPVDPKQMIADEAFFGLLEQIAEEGDLGRSLPIHMGASMRCNDYGTFGLAFKSAPDLLGSFRRIERFGKVVPHFL